MQRWNLAPGDALATSDRGQPNSSQHRREGLTSILIRVRRTARHPRSCRLLNLTKEPASLPTASATSSPLLSSRAHAGRAEDTPKRVTPQTGEPPERLRRFLSAE